MKNFYKFLLLYCALSTSTGAKYKCDRSYSDSHDTCVLYGLNLTRDNYEIELETYKPNIFKKFRIDSWNVPILSKMICKSLPELEEFDVSFRSIEEIEDGGFEHCTKIKIINLSNNLLTNLDKNTFKGLENLEELHLQYNNITKIDLDLTASIQLRVLEIYSLNMLNFVTETLREQRNLRFFYISSNNLRDIDIEEIVKFCPKLNYISLVHNKFKCSRHNEIKSILERKNIGYYLIYKHCVPDHLIQNKV